MRPRRSGLPKAGMKAFKMRAKNLVSGTYIHCGEGPASHLFGAPACGGGHLESARGAGVRSNIASSKLRPKKRVSQKQGRSVFSVVEALIAGARL